MKLTGYTDIPYEAGQVVHPEIGEIASPVASAPIARGHFVEVDSAAGTVAQATNESTGLIGIALASAMNGQTCEILYAGLASVPAAAAIHALAPVAIDANGKAVVAGADARVVGVCLTELTAAGIAVIALKSIGGL